MYSINNLKHYIMKNFLIFKRMILLVSIIFISSALYSQNVTGLTGYYFDNPDFTNQVHTRIDTEINFDWGSESPDDPGDLWGMGHTDYSIRWTGCITPLYSEAYTFYTSSNDAARLWVDDTTGAPIINDWTTHPEQEYSSTVIYLTAGTCYPVKLEYREDGGTAQIRLKWESASQLKGIIPNSQLKTIPLSVNDNNNLQSNFMVYQRSDNEMVFAFLNDKTENYSLTINDIQGRLINNSATVNSNTFTVKCSDWVSGVYLFTLTDQRNGNAYKGKFMVK